MKTANNRLVFLLPFLTVLFIIISGCDSMDSDNANQSSPTLVEVGIGESGKTFSERYSGFVKADHQPAGLSFYKASWSTKNKGRVRIAHKSHSIELSDALNFTGTEDNSARQAGISI